MGLCPRTFSQSAPIFRLSPLRPPLSCRLRAARKTDVNYAPPKERRRVSAVRSGNTVIGSVSVDMQDAAIAFEMPSNIITGSTVFKARATIGGLCAPDDYAQLTGTVSQFSSVDQ